MSKKNKLLDEFGNINVSTKETLASKPNESEVSESTGRHENKLSLELVFNMLLTMYDFIEVNGQLYIYNETFGYWKLIPESNSNREIRRLIPSSFFSVVKKSGLEELYEWLLLEATHKDENIFFKHTEYINFKDCAVFAKTREKYKKDRKKLYFRYYLNIDYPREESTGAFNAFIRDIYPDDKHSRRELSKLYGLTISDIRTLKYIAFFYGPSNTGKTISQNVLEYIIGSDYTASLSFSQVSSEFAVTQLINKRASLSGEVSGATTSRLDILKSISGNDLITACYKGKDHFQFRNRCLMIFACNCFPKINDFLEVQSFLERAIFFPFVNVKDRKDWDPNLLDKLKEDAAGIIDFALEGLKALEEDGYSFKESKAMLECKKFFNGQFDSFSMFSNKYIESDKNSTLTSSEISDMYRKYCDKNDYDVLSDNQWPQIIKRDFACVSCTKTVETTLGKTRVRGYKGIRFKSSIVDFYDNLENIEPITEIPEEYYNKGGIKYEE